MIHFPDALQNAFWHQLGNLNPSIWLKQKTKVKRFGNLTRGPAREEVWGHGLDLIFNPLRLEEKTNK